jgi:RNA polymerase-binding transcription factor
MAKAVKPKARAPVRASKPSTKSKPGIRRAPAKVAPSKSATSAKRSASKSALKTVAARPAPEPPPKTIAKPVRRAKPKLDRKMLAAVEKSLKQMQSELEQELAEIEEAAFNVSQSEMSGEVGYDEDYADAGSFTFEREKDLSIANNVQDLLAKIARSLEKINEGTYGICESCGQPIESARLKALPHALLCVSCKTQEERR